MALDADRRLRSVLAASSALVESPSTLKQPEQAKETLATILRRRILEFKTLSEGLTGFLAAKEGDVLDQCASSRAGSFEEATLKRMTAILALRCLDELSSLLRSTALPSSSTAPPLGSRDSKMVQTLAGIVSRWGIAAQVEQGILPASLREKQESDGKIVEIANSATSTGGLGDQAKRLARAVLPAAGSENPSALLNPMRALILPSVFVPLVAALLQLGHGPGGEDWAKASLQNLLNTTPPATVFPCLLLLLSSSRTPASPTYAPKTLASFLSQRLLLPDGVRAFLAVVIGVSDNSVDPPLPRLEAALNVLRHPLQGLPPEPYFAKIVPALLDIIAPGFAIPSRPQDARAPAPQGVVKAACFVLGQLLAGSERVARIAASSRVHSSFYPDADPAPRALTHDGLDPVVVPSSRLAETTALITTILINADPSPALHVALIGRILAPLLSLWLFLHTTRGDPVVREEVYGLLAAWVRTGDSGEVAGTIRSTLEVLEAGAELGNEKVYWARDAEGGVCVRVKSGRDMANADGEDIMRLRPDPDALVAWLAQLRQDKVAGKLLVAWLGELEVLMTKPGFVQAKKTLLRLQLVSKMVDDLDSAVLEDPSNILEFIKHALAPPGPSASRPSQVKAPNSSSVSTEKSSSSGLVMADLKIVDEDAGDEELGTDEEQLISDEEMLLTGLSLLTSILEAHHALSASNTPSLQTISERLDAIIHASSSEASDAALQCRMLLAIRTAAERANADLGDGDVPPTAAHSKRPASTAQSVYREALKLLEDPILPVRAQGLTLLRSLVTRKATDDPLGEALVPSVLDIFLQAVQDDDSFLYLNAIKGLGEMAERHVALIAPLLAEIYARSDAAFTAFGKVAKKSSQETEIAGKDLDKRLRIGEAMGQVIHRAGSALPMYLSRFLPPLLHVLRDPSLPAPLRSSALTLLGTCAEVSPVVITPHAFTLVDACLTLLSIESRQAKADPTTVSVKPADLDHQAEDQPDADGQSKVADQKWRLTRTGGPVYEETPDPVSKDSSHPALRRSAILFIRDLFHGNEDSSLAHFPPELLSRAHTVLSYVAITDPDGLVQHQARQVSNEMEEALGSVLRPR